VVIHNNEKGTELGRYHGLHCWREHHDCAVQLLEMLERAGSRDLEIAEDSQRCCLVPNYGDGPHGDTPLPLAEPAEAAR
jgi:hypothetical protein